jgi:hypothetical protein
VHLEELAALVINLRREGRDTAEVEGKRATGGLRRPATCSSGGQAILRGSDQGGKGLAFARSRPDNSYAAAPGRWTEFAQMISMIKEALAGTSETD